MRSSAIRARFGNAVEDLLHPQAPVADDRPSQLDWMIAELDTLADTLAKPRSDAAIPDQSQAAAPTGATSPSPPPEPPASEPPGPVGAGASLQPLLLPLCSSEASVSLERGLAILHLQLARMSVPVMIPLEIGALERLRVSIADAIEATLRTELGK